ncbi:MAG: hypothetical protein FD167_5483, partial [bacterium]
MSQNQVNAKIEVAKVGKTELGKTEVNSTTTKTIFSSSSIFDNKDSSKNSKPIKKTDEKLQAKTDSNTTSKVDTKTTTKTDTKTTTKKGDYFNEQGTAQLEQIKSMYNVAITYFPFFLVAGMAVVIGGKVAYKKLTTKTSTSHGSAHFASRREIKHLLRPMDEPIRQGELRVGKYIEAWRPKHK